MQVKTLHSFIFTINFTDVFWPNYFATCVVWRKSEDTQVRNWRQPTITFNTYQSWDSTVITLPLNEFLKIVFYIFISQPPSSKWKTPQSAKLKNKLQEINASNTDQSEDSNITSFWRQIFDNIFPSNHLFQSLSAGEFMV